jgi:CheY-like chemotaxis protein
MSFLVLVGDDEPDVEMLFRQQFRRALRDNRFRMDFAQSRQRSSTYRRHRWRIFDSDPVRHQHARNEWSRTVTQGESRSAGLPVIMITAYGDDNTRRKALEGGAQALLTKPIDFVLLRNEIDGRLAKAA